MQESEQEEAGRPGLPIDWARIVMSLRRGWRIAVIATLVSAVIGVGVALTLKKYKSESVLVWEPVTTNGRVDRELSTQVGIFRLPGILKETIRRLNLKIQVKELSKRINVWLDASSNLVMVEAYSDSPKEAARLAGTLVDVFLEHQKELARTRAKEMVNLLQEDLDTARRALRTAQDKYSRFRTQHDVVDPVKEAELALQAVNSLKTNQANAEAEANALEAQASQLGELVKKQPRTRVTSASRSNAAAQNLAQARAELTAAQSRLAPDHPEVLSLQARIKALEQQVASGNAVVENTVVAPDPEFDSMRSILSSTRAQQIAASEKGKSYTQALKQAEERLARLSAIETEARGMISEIDLNSKRIEEFEAQLVLARDAVRSPSVEFRVLTPAAEPETPEKSKRRIVAIGLTLMGLFGSILFLALRPLRGGRIYTAREAAFWSKLPVVASTAWPSREHLFFPFIDELADNAYRAKGTTLIVGIGEQEARIAMPLASALNPVPTAHTGEGLAVSPSTAAAYASSGASYAAAVEAGEPGTATPIEPPSSSTALALRSTVAPAFFAWRGALDGPALRRAVRIADRVIVVVGSGSTTIGKLATLRTRLGREQGVALVVVALSDDFVDLPDRVGDVEGFWKSAWVNAAAA